MNLKITITGKITDRHDTHARVNALTMAAERATRAVIGLGGTVTHRVDLTDPADDSYEPEIIGAALIEVTP